MNKPSDYKGLETSSTPDERFDEWFKETHKRDTKVEEEEDLDIEEE